MILIKLKMADIIQRDPRGCMNPDIERTKKIVELNSEYTDHTLYTLLLREEGILRHIAYTSHANPCGIPGEDFSLYNRLYSRLRKDGEYDVFVEDKLIIRKVKSRDIAEEIMNMFVDEQGNLVDF